MSPWLKPRLVALLCGAVFLGGATYLRAQGNYGPPAKTPEEAATNFFKLLDLIRHPEHSTRYRDDEKSLLPLLSSIEGAQYESLQKGADGPGEHREHTIEIMARQAVAQPFDATVKSSSGGQSVVLITPSAQPKSHEVVVIEEDGGYRVDIVATYGRWNHLSGIEADKALYWEAGWISPTLATQHGFLGTATLAQCGGNLRQLGLGIAMYTQDYDEVLPPARNWTTTDVLMPYVKEEQLFSCPALGKGGNGYAFNSKLNRVWLRHINSPSQVIELYETSNPNKNVFAPFTGRAYRHASGGEAGMNICFADGHVQWYARGKSDRLTIEPRNTTPGFLTISGKTR